MLHLTPRGSTRAVRCLSLSLAVVIALLALILSPFPSAHAAGVIYVSGQARGANDGTSWADAYTSLQSALGAASSGEQIWVAAGTYTPSTTGDRSASFTLKNGVAIYGGLAGTETQLSERNWSSNATILSGDIGTSGDTSDNSYHVVTGATDATLDGFTISGGNANGVDPYNKGGGIYNTSASPVLQNLIISDNASNNRGGGIYNTNSNPTLTNLVIRNNTSQGGAGIYNLNSSPVMSTITIVSNQASQNAGGLWNSNSSPTLTSVTIEGNTASTSGGGIYNTLSSNPILSDVTIEGNTASANGGGMVNLCSCSPALTNVTIRGNIAGNEGGGIYNSGSSPTLTNVTISGNQASSDGGGIANFSNSSPALTNVLISGNTATWGGGLANMTSSSTLTNVTIGGNTATWNSGIDNDYSGTLQIRNSIIWGNTASGNASALTNSNSSTATVSYTIVEGGYDGIGNLSSNPQFITDASNTPMAVGDYRVLATSPAIDAGDNSVVSATTDLAGNLRRLDVSTVADTGNGSAPIVDIGAYEARFASISSITRLSPSSSTTNAASVTFQVVFGQSLGGIEPLDFTATVVSGSLNGVGITGVSGSGTTYTVTATTSGGEGVLALDTALTARALDGSNLPIGVLPFSGSESYTIDTNAPAAPVITAISNDTGLAGDGVTGDQTLVFSGSAEAGSTVTLTRVGEGVIGTAVADSGGNWSIDYTGTSLPLGNHSFTATATDSVGNTSASSDPFAVMVHGSLIYVNDDASGANDGTSWANAYTSLQSALAAASNGDQIWIAAGTYTPTATNDRSASFTLKSGVAVYGGFDGTELALSQRDWITNATTLSGNIGDTSQANDNSYHVVTGATGATLDGVTVAGGNANGSGTAGKGGGIFNNGANPVLTHVIVNGNQASYGGGIFNDNGSNPTLTNVLISGNLAFLQGGGLYANAGSNLTLTNVTIASNFADAGSGIWINDGDLQIQNSIIWGNIGGNAFEIRPIHSEGSGQTAVNYSLVEWGYDGTGNLNGDPQFVTAVSAASAPATSGNYRLQSASPAIDAGDNSVVSTTADLAGYARQSDAASVADTGNGSAPIVDMGAYETPVITISSITRLNPSSSTTNATSVTFRVVFDQRVAGIDTSDFAATVVSGSLSGVQVTGVSGGGKTYSVTVATGTGEGVLRLDVPATARVTDTANQTIYLPPYSSGESYTIDKTAPAAPAITGLSTDSSTVGDGITNDRTLVFSGSAEAGSLVALTRVGQSVIGTATANASGTWSFDYTGTSLGDGSYSFTATASDVAGNTSASSSAFMLTVDGTITTPAITGITTDSSTAGDGITNDRTLVFNGSAEAGSLVALTRVGMGVIGMTTASSNGNWSFDYTSTSLSDGSYSFSAMASDPAGNLSSESNTFTVTIDTALPVAPVITGITTDSGIQSRGITNDSTISLNGTAEANSIVTLTRAGQGVIGTATASGAGIWSFDYTGTSLPIGSYTFTAIATDSAGNTSGSSSAFVVKVRGTVLYVNASATGANDGTSWANAYTSLQSALSEAVSGEQIWVAAGTYTPTATTNRQTSFTLKNGVTVYGGFAGSETLLSQRSWTTNISILSGDLNRNDGANFANNSENSYHIVVGATGATLDGFTITGGNANGSGEDRCGGGVYNNASSPVLNNITISGNTSFVNGGGVYNSNSSPSLTNVTISGNTSTHPNSAGGGIYNNNSNPTLTNVTISGNSVNGDGAGIYNIGSSPMLTNVTISGNSGTDTISAWGGGIYLSSGTPILTNVVISGNTSAHGGGMYINNTSNPTLTNVTITGNRVTTSGGGLYNNNSFPEIRNSIIWGNSVGTTTSSITVSSGTPAVSYSIVQGGYSGTGNLSSDPLFMSATDAASAPTTAGDYHLQFGSPAIDAGNNGVATPSLPATDRDSNPRRIDITGIADTGSGTAPLVDRGAYEADFASISSITRLSPASSTTNAISVTFQVVFDRSLSGINPSDFAATVVSGSLNGASVTGVSGSGTTYSVTVATGSGDGVLRLDVPTTTQVTSSSNQVIYLRPYSAGESYMIDKTAPAAPTITGITDDNGTAGDAITSDRTLVFSGSAEAGSTVTLTQVDGGVIGTTTADSNGTWSFDHSGTSLEEGSYSFIATATDPAGNTSASSTAFAVTVDTSTPAPVISGITTDSGSAGDAITNDRTLLLSGSAEAGSTVTLRWTNGAIIGTATADSNGIWSFDYTTISLDDGSYSFTATAVDLLGNASDNSTAFVVIVDGAITTPAITSITTDNGTQTSGITRDSTISLNGTAEASSTVTLTRAGQGVIGTATAGSNGEWSFDYTNTSLEAGNYSFTATAADLAGNTSGSSSVFVVTVLGPIIYVNDDATGANTGASWNDAMTSLQSALAIAISGDQIWVAAGTYTPSTTGDRSATFMLRTGVALYGGFAGTETQLSERNWTSNISILSGDLNGDDGADFANNSENSYHVVRGAAGARLDGFTVSSGNANGAGSQGDGGGVYNTDVANLALAHLIISRNSAGEGGGLFTFKGSATLTDSTFSNNHSTERGGSLFSGGSNLTIDTISVIGSTSAGSSAGMYIAGDNVTVTNCTVSNNTAQLAGGGVVIASGSVTLTSCTVSNNTTEGGVGSGIAIFDGNVMLVDSTVSGNTAAGGGAGVWIRYGTTRVLHSTISGNTSQSPAGGGGLLIIYANVTLENCILSENTSTAFGGAILNRAVLSLSGSTISNNTADYSGGGILNYGTATVNNSTISGNSANYGGGIDTYRTFTMTTSLVRDNIAADGGGLRLEGGLANVTNTTFSGNQASGQSGQGGGGIMVDTGTLALNNGTIAGNTSASNGGGMAISSSATVTITNTIVASNSAGANTPDLSGTLVSGGHNLVGDASGSTGLTPGSNGDQAGSSATALEPKLDALADNGGLTHTRALLDGSPAIDMGNAATCASTDQRGYIRIMPCDIGAYELGASMLANQQPTLDLPANLTILEDAAQQTAGLSGIGAGTGESQTLIVTATSSNPAIIPSPTISYTSPNASGSLSFTPVANASGTATITITVRDSGGTNGGGVDTLMRSFNVTVTAVNDAPSFTAGHSQSVKSSAGAQMVTAWASGFSAGPADESGQTLLGYTIVSISAPELFSVTPAIDTSGTLTYTTKPGVNGTTTISVVVRDNGGTANGGVDTSTAHTLTITVGGSYTVFLPLLVR